MDIVQPELLAENISTRVVAGSWLLWRATQINNGIVPEQGCESLEKAIAEAEQILYERMHNNLKEGGETVIIKLGEEVDSDVVMIIPIDNRKKRVKALEQPREVVKAVPLEFDLRDEFETLSRQSWHGEVPVALFNRDNKTDRYVDRGVNTRWVGFRMCFTALMKPYRSIKESYQRIFGNFIVGEVTNTGQVLFSNTPYRHRSLSGVYEEVNRLVNTQHKPYAIFRCVDIIDAPKVIRETPNEE